MEQIEIAVTNVKNEHCHFKRVIETSASISFPYDQVAKTLLLLYSGLDVCVNFKVIKYHGK